MPGRRPHMRPEELLELEEEWLDLEEEDPNPRKRRPERPVGDPDRRRKRDKPRWETPPHKRDDPEP